MSNEPIPSDPFLYASIALVIVTIVYAIMTGLGVFFQRHSIKLQTRPHLKLVPHVPFPMTVTLLIVNGGPGTAFRISGTYKINDGSSARFTDGHLLPNKTVEIGLNYEGRILGSLDSFKQKQSTLNYEIIFTDAYDKEYSFTDSIDLTSFVDTISGQIAPKDTLKDISHELERITRALTDNSRYRPFYVVLLDEDEERKKHEKFYKEQLKQNKKIKKLRSKK